MEKTPRGRSRERSTRLAYIGQIPYYIDRKTEPKNFKLNTDRFMHCKEKKKP